MPEMTLMEQMEAMVRQQRASLALIRGLQRETFVVTEPPVIATECWLFALLDKVDAQVRWDLLQSRAHPWHG
jgi:hypothetical protein